MNKILVIMLLSLPFFSFKGADGVPDPRQTKPIVYRLDKDSSLVVWYCQENTEMHSGGIPFVRGSFTITDGKITAGSFELSMFDIGVSDLKNASQKKNLVQRLVSKDFFDCATFPNAKFVITTPTETQPGHYLMEGNMTLKGKTRVMSIPMEVSFNNTNNLMISSSEVLIEGAAFGLKTGATANNEPSSSSPSSSTSDLKNFKFKISQLYAKKG